jgi:LacI family transcriptional regulator
MEVIEGRATIVDVARRAGVSKSTVSLVLGGSSLVAETTRERVSDAMNELGYIYHRGAATLRGAKSGVIGMVINDLSNPFYVELAIGIEQACQGGAYIPFLANTAESTVRQHQVIRSMREHGAAGLVLAPAMGTSASELKPLLAGLPVVQVMRRLPGLRASFVAPENKEGARKATAHLIAVGHRRVAFVGGVSSMLVREERLAGYRLARTRSELRSIRPSSLKRAPTTRAAAQRSRNYSTSPTPRPPLFASTTLWRSGSPAP